MTDWTRFHAATVAGSLQAEILNACERAWSWLDLAADDRRARVTEAIADETSARWMLQSLVFVFQRLMRDAGIDPGDQARLAALDEATRAGRATADELNLARRYAALTNIGQLVAEQFPAAATPAPPPDPQKLAVDAGVPALTAAIHGSEAGAVTPAHLAELRAAIGEFAAIGQGFAAPAAREHAWWLGAAWWAVGRGALELGRVDEGRDALQRATESYVHANDEKAADECRQRLRELDLHQAADFDSAAARELRALLARTDPLGRAGALTRLAHETGHTGDSFEAARIAEEAARVLNTAGYPDPEHDFDAATDAWIATAATGCTGTALLARLCQVAQFWAVVVGARASDRIKRDPAGSARAERALRRIGPLAAELHEQAGIAEQAAGERFAFWYPPAAAQPFQRQGLDASTQRAEQLNALDDALHRLRLACNEGASEAQLDESTALRAQAEQSGSRVHVARAALEQAYVLLALNRNAEVPAATRDALRALLGDQRPRLAAFTTGYEREMYLNAVNYRVRALAAQGDHDAILDACEPVIRDIEGERARVSSPYQQNAFLATRAELYEFAAAAAYKTGHFDLVLAVSELLKARAALRSRLAPELAADGNEIEAQFQQVNRALADVAPGSPDERELRERRRWLASARAIARAQAGGAATPEISIASVQGVLGADEAAISWFWIADEFVLVLAITRDGFKPALVKIDPALAATHRDYLACMTAASGGAADFRKLIPKIESLIEAFGTALLPAKLHSLIAGKTRLVLCPHRSLHLFPFHAAPWHDGTRTGYLIERFTIRYVPNLSSLLVPWTGNVAGPVLAVGIAHFDDPDLRSLPNAEAEAAAVAGAHGKQGQALVGATRAQFTSLPLHEFRCLHLATHGSSVLAGDAIDDPLKSSLYFRDGALSGWEIAGLRLRTELVVLAACHSGQRSIAGRGLDRLPGDDLFGLQAVLFEAGAGTLLGALWPVEDATALAILTAFHRAYADGAAPERALRDAVLAHLAAGNRKRTPFYWAPFFLSSLGRRAGLQ